jgi:hypothetical protein
MAEEVRVEQPEAPADERPAEPAAQPAAAKKRPVEIGGPKGPEPTRYRDWERGGICVDF